MYALLLAAKLFFLSDSLIEHRRVRCLVFFDDGHDEGDHLGPVAEAPRPVGLLGGVRSLGRLVLLELALEQLVTVVADVVVGGLQARLDAT